MVRKERLMHHTYTEPQLHNYFERLHSEHVNVYSSQGHFITLIFFFKHYALVLYPVSAPTTLMY